ncbi:gamma-glutamyltransferase family protein [Desulfonema ishimotonii]|uniref:Gamma-glutamyltransferase family protein n=1 Tax=Desulfonema ishimotonii TaxID=45657 RepID=A0A401FYR9_9BACT|nr:gamma-glutamyltransferase family protein [Desulfonema ishimotonii]GBC62118.1 gamma-glutamyltransferase family protein [Desulfonema ishimotonii]
MVDMTWTHPYPSQRMPVLAGNMVATSQPLAAQAGLRMLLRGGNAVDAALATAIALTVVEPTSNGLGSDAFALIWDGKRLHGFNGSGRSPGAWNPERFAGLPEMPITGWDTVTVPGAVDTWARLSQRFGRLRFTELFEPAIGYARNGYPVSPITAGAWEAAPEKFGHMPSFARTFLPGGRAPRPCEHFVNPDQARTLEQIADSGGEAFYRGGLAGRIAACAKAEGGAMTADDLAGHRGEWVEPVSVDYHDVRLHEIPPNGQGLAALMALGILRHHDLRSLPPDSADSLHLQIEAMKIAFGLAHAHISDPAFMTVNCHDLLDDGFLEEKARTIRPDRAAAPGPAPPADHGTVYLTAADADGMMVSHIQSNYMGFGSGVVIPETGISLQNRGHGFRLDPGHPNCVAGGKRPYHTIIPGFVTRNGAAQMSFGVMGAHMQPQGHVQMMVRIFDYGQNPQTASDAPRWHVCENGTLALENGVAPEVIEALRQRGHRIIGGDPVGGYGGAQLIFRLENGYCGASDHRKDGQAVGF